MRTAFITGITGQDGAYLSRLLLGKSYKIYGLVPRCEVDNKLRLGKILNHEDFHLIDGDLLDAASLLNILHSIKPNEIYNLGAQSHVGTSFNTAEYTAHVNGLGVTRLLDIVRILDYAPRIYQASSSELFGNAPAPQNENTPLEPCSPYAAAKLYAYHMVKIYRETYGLHASNGILFNHESPWRGEDFVTRKITKAVAEIAQGKRQDLSLGNLESRRDWGHARDYVEGMWSILQQAQPDDYILATGITYSVRDFVEAAFQEIGVQISWEGKGLEECGIDKETKRVLIKIDPLFFRPNEVHHLCGDASKAKNILKWEPQTSFKSMVSEMVQADISCLNSDWQEEDENDFFRNAA